jgi:hypothetical protein
MYCMALEVYTCQEAASGPKTFFKHILQTFATKWTFPSLTVVLIPISTHPTMQVFWGPQPNCQTIPLYLSLREQLQL